jgi:signal transduction histidine kinase
MSKLPEDRIQPSSQWGAGTESGPYDGLNGAPAVEHGALLYSSHEERLDASLSFVQQGLENDERCLYITNDVSRDEIVGGLAALGSEPETALADGQLRVSPADDVYTSGALDPDEMVATLVEMVEESVETGYDGLRVTGGIPWHDHDGVGVDDILEYERQFDATAPEFAVSSLCQYDLRTLTDSETLDLIRCHPEFIYRRQLCENPFYRSPEQLEQADGDPLSAERVLETAYQLSDAREAIERREQRVGVLNRVLRHNLRNDMNVIQSHAELIDGASDDPDVRESVATILETADRLMDIAEDAKRVEKSVSGSTPDRVPVNLRHAIDRAAERARNTHRDIALTCLVDDGTWVEGSNELEFALSELFETLARMADTESQITVGIEEDCSTTARLCLVARCEGANLPKSEVDALVEGEETQLSHGSGLGLWLVNWIVELSGGSLSFRSTEDGQDVLLELVTA